MISSIIKTFKYNFQYTLEKSMFERGMLIRNGQHTLYSKLVIEKIMEIEETDELTKSLYKLMKNSYEISFNEYMKALAKN